LKIKFDTDGDMTYRDNFDKNINFSTLSDDELWSYILGEYIFKGKLSKLEGFGVVQVDTY